MNNVPGKITTFNSRWKCSKLPKRCLYQTRYIATSSN